MKKNIRIAVWGDAIADRNGDESEDFMEKARAAIEGCEIHISLDGVEFVITLAEDARR